MGTRKIIQISFSSNECYHYVIALCNDATVWSIDLSVSEPLWEIIKPIPQT